MKKHIAAVMKEPLALLLRKEEVLLVLTSVVTVTASLASEMAAVAGGVMKAFQIYKVELVLCLDVVVAFQVSVSAVVVVLPTLLFSQVGIRSG